jgi:D-threo-aldose 1-dehydrogenase
VLEAGWAAGIRYFDTAPHYGLGLAERRLGAFLADQKGEDFIISTKAGRLLEPSPETSDRLDDQLFMVPATVRRVWDFTEAGLRRGLDESLTRLGLDHVDILYLHDPDESGDLETALTSAIPALARMRDEGLVRAVGIGSKDVDAITRAVRTDMLDLAMVAGRYTLLEQDEVGLVEECALHGVGIVAAGVFNSGLLATSHVAAGATYEVLERARRLAEACAEFAVELPAAAIQFPLRNPTVVTVVVGAQTGEQVRQNADRLTSDVPDELWDRLC